MNGSMEEYRVRREERGEGRGVTDGHRNTDMLYQCLMSIITLVGIGRMRGKIIEIRLLQ